jgi:hypothetical protein
MTSTVAESYDSAKLKDAGSENRSAILIRMWFSAPFELCDSAFRNFDQGCSVPRVPSINELNVE